MRYLQRAKMERHMPGQFVPWKKAPWVLVVGIGLVVVQLAGLLVWVGWAAYLMTWSTEYTLHDVNAMEVSTSMYPIIGITITMIPIIEELGYNCEAGVCSTQHRLVWYLAPVLTCPAYIMLFAATYKLYPEERKATIIMGWNAAAIVATSAWTVWAYMFAQRHEKRAARAPVATLPPLALPWGEEKVGEEYENTRAERFGARRLAL
jgi:hypothetical protein